LVRRLTPSFFWGKSPVSDGISRQSKREGKYMVTPLAAVLIVGASLFGTGVVVHPQDRVLGNTLIGAGVGTMVGGAVGAVGGVATAVGVTTATAVTGGAIIGGVAGGTIGYTTKTAKRGRAFADQQY